MKIRFGIRTLLVILALVATFFPFRTFYDNWFRASYSGYHIHDVLGHRVTDGDSFEFVISLFDRSEPLTEQWTRKNLGPLPDYRSGDEYFVFHMNGGNVRAFFQFRNDAVVNHDNAQFHFPYSQVQHYNDTAPNFFFRYGAIPVYFGLMIPSGLAIWMTVHVASRRRRNVG